MAYLDSLERDFLFWFEFSRRFGPQPSGRTGDSVLAEGHGIGGGGEGVDGGGELARNLT